MNSFLLREALFYAVVITPLRSAGCQAKNVVKNTYNQNQA